MIIDYILSNFFLCNIQLSIFKSASFVEIHGIYIRSSLFSITTRFIQDVLIEEPRKPSKETPPQKDIAAKPEVPCLQNDIRLLALQKFKQTIRPAVDVADSKDFCTHLILRSNMEKAKAAALAVGGTVAAPVFNEEEKTKGLTDFNDLHKSRGLAEVKRQVSHELAKDKGRGLDL